MNFNGQQVASAWKYQGDVWDYGCDYFYTAEPPFLQLDESIITSTWEVETNDEVLEIFNSVFTSTGTAIWVRSGTIGNVYVLKNTITTDQGKTGIAKIELEIR